MGYDNPERGSAGTVVAIVAVIVVVLLGGLVLLGVGALFFARTSARQAEVVARVEADRAVLELERAEKPAVRVQVSESAKMQLQEASTRELTIEVHQDGVITVDEESMDLESLRARIENEGENASVRLAVQLKVDPRCLVLGRRLLETGIAC